MQEVNNKKSLTFYSLLFPCGFIIFIWLIAFTQYLLHEHWTNYGVMPRTITGLRGIMFSPFIHANWEHLLSNTMPLLLLGFCLIYFYKKLSIKVFVLIYLLTGILVWIFGRTSFHIGASGLIYGLAGFIFVSGILRKVRALQAIGLLVTFLYGSMIWGILPYEIGISWESHLAGLITGISCAFIFRHQGPQKKKYDWEMEEEELSYENQK